MPLNLISQQGQGYKEWWVFGWVATRLLLICEPPATKTTSENGLARYKIVEIKSYISITLDINSREVQEIFILLYTFRNSLSDSCTSEDDVNISIVIDLKNVGFQLYSEILES